MENDRGAPATKGDIEDLRDELRNEIRESQTHLRQELLESQSQLRQELLESQARVRDELIEVFRDGQTEILKAFYGFAKSTDTKLKDSEISAMLLRERIGAVESRLLEVERRLNMPPAA